MPKIERGINADNTAFGHSYNTSKQLKRDVDVVLAQNYLSPVQIYNSLLIALATGDITLKFNTESKRPLRRVEGFNPNIYRVGLYDREGRLINPSSLTIVEEDEE